jgi:drug/metabolite transporter (DMT)-like permease
MNIGIFYILIANLIASTTGICVHSISNLSGLQMVFLTSFIGSILILLIYSITGQLNVFKTIKFNLNYLIYPIMQSLVTICVFLAFSDPNFITTGIELIINATPLPIIFIAYLVLGEKSTKREVLATILGFTGLVIFIAFQDSSGSILTMGLLFAVLGLICNAFAITFQRKAANSLDVRTLPFLVSLTNMLFTGIAIVSTEMDTLPRIFAANIKSWTFILLLAFMNIIIIFLISQGLKTVKSQVMSSLLLIKPVIVAMLGWFLLDERITLIMAFGGAITTSSVALTIYKPRIKADVTEDVLQIEDIEDAIPDVIMLSIEEKLEVILRMIRGEHHDSLSNELGIEKKALEKWYQSAIKGISNILTTRPY